MSKIFSKNQGPAVDVKRNTFDLSYGSHVTGKIGDLIPVFCQEVIPGDSFEIDPKFGLRFNPTVFPIQTKMHGIMHFFYVRNRNLYKDWMEYITRTKDDAVMPYLRITESDAKDIIGTGSLGDYLGVPTTLTGDYARYINYPLDVVVPIESGERLRRGSSNSGFLSTALSVVNRKKTNFIYIMSQVFGEDGNINLDFVTAEDTVPNWYMSASPIPELQTASPRDWTKCYGYMGTKPLKHSIELAHVTFSGEYNLGTSPTELSKGAYLVFTSGKSFDTPLEETNVFAYAPIELSYDGTNLTATCTDNSYEDAVNERIGVSAVYCGIVIDSRFSETENFISDPTILPTDSAWKNVGDSIIFSTSGIQILDATDEQAVTFNPFVIHAGQNTPKIKLNALPFRAYESIYNYFYRDETVDPFKINGNEVYNDFIPTHDGGADFTPYRIHQKNWERDYYTSCQTSPQQGTAPLVGISANGTFTFDDGTNHYTASMKIGDDGETITGISTYSPDMPKGSLRQLMDVVTNGISINDLRNVNSLQRWLETNIRRGYKYVDQIYSHFGVNPAFKANDCPEFIGGIHAVADVNQVNNNTSEGLGDYAGQLSMFGGSDNKIHQYCDEHGYIIGIMSVFPEPVYSQMLPKHFTKTETPLDFFFPEFGHIGMQPITYNEVTPLEVAAADHRDSTDTINDVFGYQRAWADYLANNDQVHGDFRTSMSEYVVNRVFNDKPELGHDFIAIDENDINDVFVTTDDSDKMLGELRFDVKAKRPIPEYGIPRLE